MSGFTIVCSCESVLETDEVNGGYYCNNCGFWISKERMDQHKKILTEQIDGENRKEDL